MTTNLSTYFSLLACKKDDLQGGLLCIEIYALLLIALIISSYL